MSEIKKNNLGTRLFRNGRIKKPCIALAVLILIAAVFIWPGHVRFWDGFRYTFYNEPDKVLSDNEDTRFTPGKNDPVTADLDDGFITVVSLIVETGSTHLAVHLERLPAFRVFPGHDSAADAAVFRERLDNQLKKIYLRDQHGKEYHYREGNYSIEHFYCSACATGLSWFSDVYLELPPLDSEANIITLIVPLPDGSEIEIDIPAEIIEKIRP